MESIKKEIKKIDDMIDKVKKINHKASRDGMLFYLQTKRNEITSKIGINKG
jgi:hypothetical protein